MTAILKMGEILRSPKTKVVICCGAGGVGKTTTAAALALRAAQRGRRAFRPVAVQAAHARGRHQEASRRTNRLIQRAHGCVKVFNAHAV